ncbi:hypothetical protein PROFUN_09813 [Planoprotostelium fungivorum]|uniref:Small acidic protein-like domain-containing protein n=1 Tax=Planoprotostelium fungivorum TaxID=1890364 RepID=A0A2P6NGQ0_9EUKA|nr:hypothetical protein PROFUN_09813 [Planoprotostelium fungivorum]
MIDTIEEKRKHIDNGVGAQALIEVLNAAHPASNMYHLYLKSKDLQEINKDQKSEWMSAEFQDNGRKSKFLKLMGMKKRAAEYDPENPSSDDEETAKKVTPEAHKNSSAAVDEEETKSEKNSLSLDGQTIRRLNRSK